MSYGPRRWQTTSALIASLLALGTLFTLQLGACSVVLDREENQCSVDADCEKFGGLPTCSNRVCVASGLGPEGCVNTTSPKNQIEYLNACSTSKCEAFDNCARLGLCSEALTLPAARAPSNPTIPPLVNPLPAPTLSCKAGATNMIYMYGAADFAPLLQAAQPLLSASNPPYRAVFQNASSCAGVASIFDPSRSLMKDPINPGSGGWAFYFDDAGRQVNCLLDPAGNTIDIGVSDLYAPTCNAGYQPGPVVGEYIGPVVPFVLSVPATSTEQSISVEAAHAVFGHGGRMNDARFKDAMPWTDPNYYFVRNSGAASTVLTSLLVDVPASGFWGVDRLSTENLRDSLLASTAVSQSIGIVSIDYNDKNRGNLRALYLQAAQQKCGYQPDSSPTSYDKANVRDGHYPLWGYVHFFTRLGPGGVPTAAASAMVLRFSVPRLEQSLVDNVIAASLIPQCAMKVSRTTEVGNFAAQTGFQCGCYFDFKTKGKSSCQTCQTAEECPSSAPACNYGYCEKN
jgi:hypothetical protein